MVKITKKLLEKNGFNVVKDEQGYNIQQHTPAGEDWNMFFVNLQDLEEYAKDYHKDEDLKMWIEAKANNSCGGIPSYRELIDDADWKEKTLKQTIG